MIDSVQPRTASRAIGGWLATSPPGAQFKIGTTGRTEQEAIDRFYEAWERWSETLSAGATAAKRPDDGIPEG